MLKFIIAMRLSNGWVFSIVVPPALLHVRIARESARERLGVAPVVNNSEDVTNTHVKNLQRNSNQHCSKGIEIYPISPKARATVHTNREFGINDTGEVTKFAQDHRPL